MHFVKTVLIVANVTADTIEANCRGIFCYTEGVIESLEIETVFIIGNFCTESFLTLLSGFFADLRQSGYGERMDSQTLNI